MLLFISKHGSVLQFLLKPQNRQKFYLKLIALNIFFCCSAISTRIMLSCNRCSDHSLQHRTVTTSNMRKIPFKIVCIDSDTLATALHAQPAEGQEAGAFCQHPHVTRWWREEQQQLCAQKLVHDFMMLMFLCFVM